MDTGINMLRSLSVTYTLRLFMAYPIISQFVPLVRSSLLHTSCIALLVLFINVSKGNVTDVENSIRLWRAVSGRNARDGEGGDVLEFANIHGL